MGQAFERDSLQEARRKERGQMFRHGMKRTRWWSDNNTQLRKASEHLLFWRRRGGGQTARAQLYLLPKFENLPQSVGELLDQSGKLLVRGLHRGLELCLCGNGARVIRQHKAFQVFER